MPIAAISAAESFASARACAGRGELRLPDRFGIVLDVAGRRQDLRELLLSRGHDAAVACRR